MLAHDESRIKCYNNVDSLINTPYIYTYTYKHELIKHTKQNFKKKEGQCICASEWPCPEALTLTAAKQGRW